MNIFLKIYVLIFLFIILFCTILFAETGEFTASWEREADGRIWSECVLNPQYSIDIKYQFRLNSFCDHRAFKKIAAVRKEMLSSIRNAISAGGLSDVIELCGYVLEFCASIGIAPLRDEESMLLSRLLRRKRHMDSDKMIAVDRSRGNGTLALSKVAVNVNPPRRDISKGYTNRSIENRLNSLTCRVNLSIYSLRFNKVDYFRLILYLWEDNPFYRMNHTTCSSRFNAILISLVPHSLQIHLSGKIFQERFNQNSKGETQSALFRDVSPDYTNQRKTLPNSSGYSEWVIYALLRSERFRGTGGSS